MAYYRLYFLDGSGTHITGFTEFEAETDEAAIGTADAVRRTLAMELWCERRKVRRWEARASGMAAGGDHRLSYS